MTRDPVVRHRMGEDLSDWASLIRDELREYGDAFTEIERTRLSLLAKYLEKTRKLIEDADKKKVRHAYPSREYCRVRGLLNPVVINPKSE
jgi:hypothetical protein